MTNPANPFGPSDTSSSLRPVRMHLERERGLTVAWSDGRESFYPVAHLRRLSPSADARAQREALETNPLTVLKSSGTGPVTVEAIERVGRYAIRLRFSDGHQTGIYTWGYLREIDPRSPGVGGSE